MQKYILYSLLFLSVLFIFGNTVSAQPAWTINLLDSSKRSQKFEDRKLGSEKLAEKKFTKIRHVFQNNYTHYNYYYNANNKIKAVIERAKASQKDDYTKLLSYYPYTLDNTAAQKSDLDSVIYKATAGILLHDLRNDWVDNMYLLMGQAYFFRKDFDSAAATFQFINYYLFPRKKNEDDNRIVGTGDASSSGNLSIANKEKRNILQKLTAQPPSRNDAFIWMIHTLIEQNELGDAAALINTLQHDPNLPERLVNDLAEVNAYWFFKQNIYDSAATHLEKAISNTTTKQDQAREEFLLAQLFEISHQYDKATIYYNKASVHTTDPLMDIYAQLNNAKMMKGTDPKELDKSIANLISMAKKDRFEPYRDIIYYSAGELSLQKPDTSAAILLYTKSLKFNEANVSFKNKAFLRLADIAYDKKQYKVSFAWYDSLQSGDTALTDRLQQIQERRTALSKIVEKIIIIEKEDSLQAIAALPLAERTALIKKMVKQINKEKGIKTDDNADFNSIAPISFDSKQNTPPDLFDNNTKGEWYFYNSSLKSKGQSDFKRKWGNRTNTDNWRRKSAAENQVQNNGNTPDLSASDADAASKAGDASGKAGGKTGAGSSQPADFSFEGLMANLPLTPEKLVESNNKVAINLYGLAKLYQSDLEDYRQAIVTYDSCLKRFPDSLYNGEIYLGLYYCYNKLGDKVMAEHYKNMVAAKFALSTSNKLLTNPAALNPGTKNDAATHQYEGIYNLFIEGKFTEALEQKKTADSLYGNNYWSPQLLYIEAVYHVKQHEDSIATSVLNNIVSLYPRSLLKPKAERMIDVLQRRKEIEKYLTALTITRAKDDDPLEVPREKLVRNDSNLIVSPKHFDSSKAVTIIAPPKIPVAKDSIKKAAPLPNGSFVFNAEAPQNVMMILDKVDGTYIGESKNAFTRYVAENFNQLGLVITKTAIDKDLGLLVFASFPNVDSASDFLYKIRKAAPNEVSWLPASKYSFLVISDDNLQLLLTNKNLKGYKDVLNKQYPGKF